MSYAPTQQQERETEQVVGVVTGIVQKGADKWQAAVAPDGSQYAKNLWTKDAQLVAYLSSQIGNRLAFACNVSHWAMQDGTPVRSLWIDQVGPPSVGSPAMAGPPQNAWEAAQQAQAVGPVPGYVDQRTSPPPAQPPMPVQQPQPPAQDDREQKIHRQTAAKVAAILLAYVKPEEQNLSNLFVMSERLVAYFNDGLPNAETLDQLMQRAAPASIDGPGVPPDSDIPF
jgi:hypothetical protein